MAASVARVEVDGRPCCTPPDATEEAEGSGMSSAETQHLSQQIDDLKSSFGKVLGGVLVLAVAVLGGAFTVWAQMSVHDNELANMKNARVTERIAALEAQKFTASDGAALAASVTTQLQALTNTVTDLKIVLARSVRERETERGR